MYYFARLIEVITAGFTSKIIEKVTFEQRFIEKVISEEKLKEDKDIHLLQRHQNGVCLMCLENGLKETGKKRK